MSQKPDKVTEKQKLVPMEQPLKKHGDKMDVGRLGGEAKKDGPNQTGGAGDRKPRRSSLRSRAHRRAIALAKSQGGLGPQPLRKG